MVLRFLLSSFSSENFHKGGIGIINGLIHMRDQCKAQLPAIFFVYVVIESGKDFVIFINAE